MNSKVVASGILGMGAGMVFTIGIVWFILVAIAEWKLFEKAGRPGWHALIPFLRDYDLFDMCWVGSLGIVAAICSGISVSSQTGAKGFMLTLAGICGVVNLVLSIMMSIKLSKAFGKGTGFAVGLILFQPIFLLILGFSDARYQGRPN